MRRNVLDILEAGKKQKGENTIRYSPWKAEYAGALWRSKSYDTGGFEFPVASFQDIAAVTNNFHESFMIGQGGFGKV
jgi:hypothetical protein